MCVPWECVCCSCDQDIEERETQRGIHEKGVQGVKEWKESCEEWVQFSSHWLSIETTSREVPSLFCQRCLSILSSSFFLVCPLRDSLLFSSLERHKAKRRIAKLPSLCPSIPWLECQHYFLLLVIESDLCTSTEKLRDHFCSFYLYFLSTYKVWTQVVSTPATPSTSTLYFPLYSTQVEGPTTSTSGEQFLTLMSPKKKDQYMRRSQTTLKVQQEESPCYS